MSPRSKSPKSTFVGPGRPLVEPNVSYSLRFSGSESTSYAACTSLNFRSASSSPGFLSGWYCAGELAVRLLQLVCGRVLGDAESLVVRLRHAVCLLPVLDRARRRRPRADDDARRAQHVVAEPVALLQHLDHRALGRVRRLREQRLLGVRVEASPRSRPRRAPRASSRSPSERWTRRTPSATFVSPCSTAASTARSRSSTSGSSCFTSRSEARATICSCSRATRLR